LFGEQEIRIGFLDHDRSHQGRAEGEEVIEMDVFLKGLMEMIVAQVGIDAAKGADQQFLTIAQGAGGVGIQQHPLVGRLTLVTGASP
jgi:hypothetical protein